MRIVILSWYPTYPYKETLKLSRKDPQHPITWVYNLAKGLRSSFDADVHIISFNSELLYDQNVTDESNGFSIHYLKPSNNLLKYFFFFYEHKKLKMLLADLKPDLVHGQGTVFPSSEAIRMGYPHVITIHGLIKDFIKSTESLKSILRLIINLFIENITIIRAKNIIVISEYVNQSLKNLPGKQKFFIPNAISAKFFEETPDYNSDRILFIGNDVERKGLMKIIEILKKIPELKLTIISTDVTGYYTSSILPYINDQGLNDRVKYFRHLDNDKIPAVISGSFCLVLPSRAETAPMVIAEANAVGIPVIASNVGGIPDMIVDGRTGFVVKECNSYELESRIKQLNNDRALTRRMGKEAKILAENLYHPDAVVKNTYMTYAKILSGDE